MKLRSVPSDLTSPNWFYRIENSNTPKANCPFIAPLQEALILKALVPLGRTPKVIGSVVTELPLLRSIVNRLGLVTIPTSGGAPGAPNAVRASCPAQLKLLVMVIVIVGV